MSTEPVSIPQQLADLPKSIDIFLQEADSRIDDFYDAGRGKQYPRFIPADYLLVYHALSYIKKHNLALGSEFCEWGSGFGVVTCLADMTGFNATGIEIEEALVTEAERLKDTFGCRCRFLARSMIPDGFDSYEDAIGESIQLTQDGMLPSEFSSVQPYYPELERGPEEFDVFYAYPWPGEEQMIVDLFELTAAPGSLLLTYHGTQDIRLARKE